MRLTIHTERGTFDGMDVELKNEEIEESVELLEMVASGAKYFKLDTNNGYVVLAGDLLKTAAFVVHK